MSCKRWILPTVSLFALLLQAGTSHAGGGSAPLPDEVGKQLEALRKAVATLDNHIRVSLAQMERDAELNGQEAKRELNELKKQLAQLRLDVDKLSKAVPEPERTSRYGSATTPPPPNARNPVTGRIEFVNRYPTPITVLFNNQPYAIASGETWIVTAVPAGAFTYQVLGVQGQPQTRILGARETYTIGIQP